MLRNNEQVIIKRQQNRAQKPQGGGAWKVAFADFTLAMMSLFLVLWILAVSNQEEREAVATNLRNYSLLDKEANPFDIKNSPYPVDFEGNPSVMDELVPEYTQDGQPHPRAQSNFRQQGRDKAGKGYDSLIKAKYNDASQMEQLAGFIEKLGENIQAKDNLKLQIVPQGLRILIRDDDEREMYPLGSSHITPFFHHLLMALAPVFQRVENKVMISGHTDSAPYSGKNYSNWELSSDRAMVARRVLEAGGMPSDRIAQVVGMADRMPENQDDTRASTNRRIELLILTDKADKELAALFDHVSKQVNKNSAVNKTAKSDVIHR